MKIICSIFVVAIKDLKVCLNNSNLSIEQCTICFKASGQKRETSKQTENILYYKY